MNKLALAPLPWHRRIREELARDIAEGRLQPGEPLPSESELAVRFGVSRGTVRQAVASLRADGSVFGGRGAPPLVRGGRLQQPFTELLSFSSWIASLGGRPSGVVVAFERGPADAEIAETLGVAVDAPVSRLVRLRLADNEPLMVERTTFPADIGDVVAMVDLEHQSIYAELAGHGIVFDYARQLIDSVPASTSDARLLGLRARAPVLRVRRLSFSPSGRPLEWSEDHYRGDRVTLSIDNSASRPALVRQLAPARGA